MSTMMTDRKTLDIQEATDFVFNLAGSCGYNYKHNKLSFQKIDYLTWDLYYCHNYRYTFPRMDYLSQSYGLDLELDCVCVLFRQNTRQIWSASWLYRQATL